MLLSLAVLAVLTSEPLLVRVLEAEHLSTLSLSSERVRCDDVTVTPAVTLTATADGVVVSGKPKPCQRVIAEGVSTVKAGELTRRYPGQLEFAADTGQLRIINRVDVEAYLPSVVAAEANGSPAAALEAQAIVSRTFALTGRSRHERAGYHLCDLTHCQWYRGLEATAEATSAVTKTKAQVLLVGGIALKPALFHSACGGHTSSAADVFHTASAGAAIDDKTKSGAACKDAPDFQWTYEVDRLELAKALGLEPTGDAFVPLERDKGGRVLQLTTFGKRMDGGEFSSRFGRAFGWRALKSLKVSAEEIENAITFRGTGLGHGVGLCQHGARALASTGWDAKRLLSRYFPDAQVRTVEE